MRERERESKPAFPKIGKIFVLLLVVNLYFPQIAGATIYQPGETLEPDCAPGSANCGVATLVGVINGGTGLTSLPSYGKLLVGNSSGGYTLTATSSLGLGGSSGTVTSVALTAPTGFTVTGSPITTGGTLVLSFTSGYNIPLTASTTDFNTAYLNRITSASSPLSITNHVISLSTAGDWTGTFDGQEGSYYLNAANLSNFVTPFSDFFSATTTDALTQGSTNKYYSNSFVQSFIHASSTIPKTYTSNTFTGANVFNSTFTLGSLSGPLQANAGLVSATTSIGVHYGGTGLSSVPTYGKLLVGNSSGGYTLTATSSLGLGGSGGTVSSVNVSGGSTGLSFSGGPITSSGTLTLAGTLNVANGGTGLANVVAGRILYGNGTSRLATTTAGTAGQVLALLNGVPTWSATTTFSSGLTYANGNVTNTGVTSIAGTSNQITVSGSTGSVTISFPTYVSLTNASTSAFSNVGTAYFGGTATSTFSSTGALTLPTGAQLFVSNQGIEFSESDTNPTCASGNYTIYADTSEGKLKKCQNGTASDLDMTGSNLQSATSFLATDVALSTGATSTLTSVSVTPSTATGDIFVQGSVSMRSASNTDGRAVIAIRKTNCTGTILAELTELITEANAVGSSHIYLTAVQVDTGASSQTYALCGSAVTQGHTATDYSLSATVIDTGADLAEIYTTNDDSLEAGDVVSIDPALKTGILKSNGAHDPQVLGIVSTKPAMVIGGVDKEGVKALPVALSGRVPVKVITENGVIHPGDYLAPSSMPGVAMKSNGASAVIGLALSVYSGEGVGMVTAFVKNFDLGPIGNAPVFMGDISPKVNADGSDNGLSTLVATIQSETVHDPVAMIAKKILDGTQFLTDFVAARVTAIRGYFDEVFAKKVHTEQICAKKSDGSEACVNGDQLNSLLQNTNITPVVNPAPSTNEPPADNSESTSSSTPAETSTDTPPTVPDLSAGEAGVTAPVVSEPTPTETAAPPEPTPQPSPEATADTAPLVVEPPTSPAPEVSR